MMQFRTIKSWLVDYVGTHAADYGFRVVGYNDTEIDSTQIRGANRLLQVYVKSGDFPRNASAHRGPVVHDVSVSLELLTACSASVDLSVLDSPTATPAELSAALAASQKAAQLADEDFDEFFEVVYQLIMDNDNADLGHDGEVGNRWVANWKKGSPLNRGENVIISGTIDFSFRVAEDLTGALPIVPTTDQAVRVAVNAAADEAGTPQSGSAVKAGG